MDYIPRTIEPALAHSLGIFPVVMLEGARQVGKSTSAMRICQEQDGHYLTLDDLATRHSLAERPVQVLEKNIDRLQVVDEVQRMPELYDSIKLLVDRSRRPGMFLLTASGEQYKRGIRNESMAGRKKSMFMHPLSQMEISAMKAAMAAGLGETGNAPPANRNPMTIIQAMYEGLSPPSAPCDTLAERVVASGYPLAMIDSESKEEHLRQYVQQVLFGMYVEQTRSKSLVRLPEFFGKLARMVGRQFNKSELASDMNDTEYAARTLYELLLTSFVISELPCFGFKLGKRKVGRKPKVYLNDSGLLATWLGLDGQDPSQSPHWGRLLENFVCAELRKHFDLSEMPLGSEVSYYGEHNGIEVDFMINKGVDGDFVAVEVKATSQVDWHDTKNLVKFLRLSGSKCRRAIILYSGSEAKALSSDIEAWPLSCLWSWDLPKKASV